MTFAAKWRSDFVLVYGLIEHREDAIHVLRLAARMCRRHILTETQVFRRTGRDVFRTGITRICGRLKEPSLSRPIIRLDERAAQPALPWFLH